MAPHQNGIGVHLLLEREGRVLLGKRRNTPYAEGFYHLPAGHLEEGESAARCAVREAAEELAVRILERDLELVHVLHNRDADDGQGRMQLFFRVAAYQGEPTVAEPDKCEAWLWFPKDALPEPTVSYTRTALAAIAAGQTFTATGWDR